MSETEMGDHGGGLKRLNSESVEATNSCFLAGYQSSHHLHD